MTSQTPMSYQIRVGLFIFIGLVIVSISLFLVGGDKLFKSYTRLHAYFENVQGLNEGSMVSLAGVRVGNVEEFIFVPEENKLKVILKIDSQYLPRITEGATADIRTQGALGDKFVYIIPGSPGGKPLKDGDRIPVAASSDLLSVLSQKSSDLTKFFDILDEMHRFSKTLNADNRAEKMMINFTETSQDLKATAREAKELMSEIRSQDSKKMSSAVDKLDRILTKIDRGEGTLGALINDPSLHDSLKSLVGAPDKKKSIKSLIRSSIERSAQENP